MLMWCSMTTRVYRRTQCTCAVGSATNPALMRLCVLQHTQGTVKWATCSMQATCCGIPCKASDSNLSCLFSCPNTQVTAAEHLLPTVHTLHSRTVCSLPAHTANQEQQPNLRL